MAQSHCQLPWLANLNNFGNTLPQHIQGVVVHGRNTMLYRTFHTVGGGANLQIHTLLLTLEMVYKKDGKTTILQVYGLLCILNDAPVGRLPDTVYVQIDGGSENTAKAVLFMCELLVVKRLIKHLVVSRLIVGHTHCDIDAVFGTIWKRMRVSNKLNSFIHYFNLYDTKRLF